MKKRIGIDLDSTVYDFIGTFRQWMCERTGRNAESFPTPTVWDFAQEWGYESAPFWAMFEEFVAGGGFERGEMLPAALDGIELLAANFEICFVTHRNLVNAHVQLAARLDTGRWLARYALNGHPLHFVQDKTSVRIDALIDDCPAHLIRARAAGILPVAIAYPYNRELDVPRFANVLEAAQFLCEHLN